MRLSDGKKILVKAPAGGFTKDVPCLVGALLVVPNFTAEVGDEVVCFTQGFFNGPTKVGDVPQYEAEPVYFEASEFTKTKPTTTGEVAQAVGVFVDNGILLTGGLVTEFVA